MTHTDATADRPPGSGPGGVIHDIGYRHFTGTRLDRSAIRRTLYVASLRGAFGLGRSGRSKVLPMILTAAMVVPAFVIIAVINIGNLSEQPIPYARYAIVFQLILAIFVAAQAPQLVSRDLRFRTITLYFARPLERVDYVLAKYAAMATAVYLITAAPLVVLYVGGLLAGLPFGEQTAEFAGGLLGLVVLALVVGGIGLVFAALTPRRGFAVALVIVVLLVSFAGVNLVAAVIWEEGGSRTVAGWVGLFSPITLFDGVQHWLLRAESSAVAPPPGTAGGLVFCAVAVGVVAACFLVLQARYRRLAAA